MAKNLIAITPTAIRQWADNPPRDSDYVPVHTTTLRRLASAIEALDRLAEPVKWEVQHAPNGHDVDWPVLTAVVEKSDYYRRVAKEALQGLEAGLDNTPDYCPEKLKPGGCGLHNLHCGYPRCNRPPRGTV